MTPQVPGLIHITVSSRAAKPAGKARGSRIESDKVRVLTARLLRHFRQTARDLPWRRTSDPYAIWVSEMMLQQTQIATVIPYYERWMTELPDASALAAAPLDQLLRLWAGLGYYARPRRFQEAARQVLLQHKGRWPQDVASWTRLPGVGRYTAGAICSIAFNQPTPVVDGNVRRVLSRLWGISTPTHHPGHQEHLWALAEAHVRAAAALPARGRRNCADFNQALMEFGALVCTPRRPGCDTCPLAERCVACQAGIPEQYPRRPPTTPVATRHLRVWILCWRGRLCLQRHPERQWNQDLWQFPTESLDGAVPRQHNWVPAPHCPQPLFALNHAITNHRFKVQVVLVEGVPARRLAPPSGQWHTPAEILQLPLSGLHRKIHQRWFDSREDREPVSPARKADSTTFRTHCSSDKPPTKSSGKRTTPRKYRAASRKTSTRASGSNS